MSDVHLFVRALMERDNLSAEELILLRALPLRTRTFSDGEEMIRQGERVSESCLIVSGFAIRAQNLLHGARQIMAVHIAGDFVDLHAFQLKVMDHSVDALGACTACFVPHEALRRLTEKSAHLTRLLWLSTVIDGAMQRAWITGLGRLRPVQNLAHLVCELYVRLEAVGLACENNFRFPTSQEKLGDMLGLSVVHTNRTVKDLRATGLVTWKGHDIQILDMGRLQKFAEFEPTYLNLWNEPR